MPPSTNLSDLIEELHDNIGKDVVVLIDEYDKGILDNITNIDLAIEIRDILKKIL
ncbi:MAG: Pseudogene of AAA family ATPase [Methanobrevibacter sp. CfCl-M3]